MSFCSKCGGMLAEGVAFCPKCGAPVAQQSTQPPPLRQDTSSAPPPRQKQSPVKSILLAIGFVLVLMIVGVFLLYFVLIPSKNVAQESHAQETLEKIATAQAAYSSLTDTRSYGTLDQLQSRDFLDERFAEEPATVDGYVFKTEWADKIGFCVSAKPINSNQTSFFIDNSLKVQEGNPTLSNSSDLSESTDNPQDGLQPLAWAGEWTCTGRGEDDQAIMTIESVTENGFEFEISAAWGTNSGIMSGTATFKNGRAFYTDSEGSCTASFSLSNGILSIETNDCEGYGGLNVVFDGEYRKN